MRTLHTILLTLLLTLASCVTEPEGENVDIGKAAPDFQVSVYSGGDFASPSPVSLSSMKGRPVVLVFFNTSCPDCREEFPDLQRLYDQYAGEVSFLCVARTEPLESVEAYWKENGLTLPVSPQTDAKVYHLYAESIIPRTYVLDSAGVIVASFSDSPVADFDTLTRTLRTLLP